MGHILQRVKLSADKTATVQVLVDSGATSSVIPESLARSLGVKRLRRSVPITLADGRRVKLDAATAIFRIGEREAPALGLTVDSRRRRLAPSRSYAVRLGGYR
jgi:predicted aspartyl protease